MPTLRGCSFTAQWDQDCSVQTTILRVFQKTELVFALTCTAASSATQCLESLSYHALLCFLNNRCRCYYFRLVAYFKWLFDTHFLNSPNHLHFQGMVWKTTASELTDCGHWQLTRHECSASQTQATVWEFLNINADLHECFSLIMHVGVLLSSDSVMWAAGRVRFLHKMHFGLRL